MFLRDSIATCDSDITTLFANHFSFSYSNPALVNLAESDCDIVLDNLTVTASDVNSVIHSLDDSVKSGPDLVPPYLLKHCPQLVEPLLVLFNRSLSELSFPIAWKTAYIYPIHKKGNKQDIENYRPISILSCFSKLLDSVVSKYISEFLLLKIAREQHGFTRGRSTITSLLLFTNYVSQSFESGHQVDALYIDFSKAFDSVSHVRLLQKVWNVGIRGNLYRWMSSYLTHRTQFVRINDCLSRSIIFTSGVPQGSHLSLICS